MIKLFGKLEMKSKPMSWSLIKDEMIIQRHKVSQRNESRSKLGDEGLHQLNKSRRKSYDRETKLETIKYFNRCSNKYKTAKQFGITPTTLRGWLKNEDLI